MKSNPFVVIMYIKYTLNTLKNSIYNTLNTLLFLYCKFSQHICSMRMSKSINSSKVQHKCFFHSISIISTYCFNRNRL
nr:MAG TPA: hypothetical protein [Caudoviricetes sp.]